jgi:ABC-type transport system involved in cytochrome c biogenesis ATPase subunit
LAKKKHKKTVKKSATVATTRSTAGPGFRFEDQVAAWLLLQALTGQELPGLKGKVARLQMQVHALGWELDDILFTTDAGPDDIRYLAISCKSNEQVSAVGFPSDFIDRAWKQWDPVGPHPMRRDADCLMLATRQRHNAFQATWSEIKLAAADADPMLGLARIQATAKYRRVFESVKTPATTAGLAVTDVEVLALIRHIEVMPLDFDIAGGQFQSLAENACRSLLASGDLTEARTLWNDLVGRAENVRLSPSTLSLEALWQELRTRYALKDHPDFAAAWCRLRAISADYQVEIQTALPSNYALKRQTTAEKLKEALARDAVCVVYGDSGTGKSALVRMVLDSQFPNALQVWLGPEELESALSEAKRSVFGLTASLLDVLRSSTNSNTFLVIDAAERLAEGCMIRAKELIAALAADSSTAGCRVLIVGQSDAGTSGILRTLAGFASPRTVEIPRLEPEEVSEVLWATNGLQWLAAQDDAVEALRNLKALAWVIDGAALFQAKSGAQQLSLTTIADRLWPYWTGGKPSLQRLLMKLGEREASFEHSFALTSFDSGEITELNALPKACPLRTGNNNRLQFEHDLAADWARFQRLKQDAHDVKAWAGCAGNPLWNNALRMLGQHLLRQPDGARTQWDIAFDEAEQLHDVAPLAADILLDALFLDPKAATFLNDRADMLFANNAKRLTRLLRRFEHIASIPGSQPNLPSGGLDISLYLEAQYRTPIYVRWPAIAKFLTQHRDRIIALTSPVVAAVCERWLTTTPAGTPLRKEFAEIALGSARELQYANEVTIIWQRDPEKAIYSAAFASAADLPDEVAQWALEMVQRRPLRADIVARVHEFRRQEAEEHRKRIETDAAYRAKMAERRSHPIAFPSARKLPPWPLGPQGSVERHYRESVLDSPRFQVLMQERPEAASEILLAAVIEDSPVEEYGNRARIDDELGIEYEHDGYPTAFWKSPLFAFLQINPEAALGCLRQLVEFCTERSAHEITRQGGTPNSITLTLGDNTKREFSGGFRVFSWSQENSLNNGQLHSALAALEKWLCMLIERQTDVTTYVDDLLHTSRSTAIVGVLINVGKYKPDLFKGPLKPLLGEDVLYFWDHHRVDNAAMGVDLTNWARAGELIFQMGRDWVLAPYRKVKLQQIAADLLTQDDGLAQYLLAATSKWEVPTQGKEAVEFRVLMAALDHRNYVRVTDPASGLEKVEFTYPADVLAAIQTFNEGNGLARRTLGLPEQCRSVLERSGMLTEESAAYLAEMMGVSSGDADIKLKAEFKNKACVAAAAALLCRAPEWLAEHADIKQRARAIMDAVVNGIDTDSEDSRSRRIRGAPEIQFAAYVVADDWIATPSKETDEAVMRIMTSGDDTAVAVLFNLAYRNRDALGNAWWRLLFLSLLRAGLSILAPRFDDGDDVKPRWQRWLRWLRTRRISGVPATIKSIDLLRIAERVEKFERRRWRERYARDRWRGDFDLKPGRRMSGGLDTHFLEKAFGWLFAEGYGLSDPAEQTALLSAFWSHEAWRLRGSVDDDDDDDDFKSSGQLAYSIVWALAQLALSSPVAKANAVWEQVFAIGPRGHYAIGAFLTQWFMLIKETTDATDFSRRWRPMIEYALGNKQWAANDRWYHAQQLERQVLGFGSTNFITRVASHAVLIDGMRELYKAWAESRLPSDQDNMAGFCAFLSTDAGHVLRMDGVQWIAVVLRADPETGNWYGESTSDAFMALLETAVLEDADELAKNPAARQALVELTAHAVARQLPRSLPLQERVRRLR